jgi:hypothetical protein
VPSPGINRNAPHAGPLSFGIGSTAAAVARQTLSSVVAINGRQFLATTYSAFIVEVFMQSGMDEAHACRTSRPSQKFASFEFRVGVLPGQARAQARRRERLTRVGEVS